MSTLIAGQRGKKLFCIGPCSKTKKARKYTCFVLGEESIRFLWLLWLLWR